MRLLVLGGTAWLSSSVTAIAVQRGHDVTCLARGEWDPSRRCPAAPRQLTPRPLPATLADTLAWELARDSGRGQRAGLSDDEERELLQAATRRPS